MNAKIVLLLFLGLSSARAETLVVLNKSEATASLFDLKTKKIVATVATGIGPHEVAVSPDGELAVVSNYGSETAGTTLTVIDIPKAKVASSIPLKGFSRPHGLQWIAGTNEILVSTEDQKSVLRVDVAQRKVVAAIATQQNTSHMVSIAQKMKRAFVANIGSGTVSAIDLSNNTKLKDISSGAGAEGIDVSPNEKEVWVTNRDGDTVSILDTKSLEVIGTVKSSSFPIRVKFSSDGKLALVTNAKSGTLNFYDSEKRSLLQTLSFGEGSGDTAGRMFGKEFSKSTVPIGILIHPKLHFAYVAHANKDAISVVDLKSMKVVEELNSGREPDGMGYSPLTVTVESKSTK